MSPGLRRGSTLKNIHLEERVLPPGEFIFIEHSESEIRNEDNYLYKLTHIIINSSLFTSLILIVILTNTVIVFLDRYPIPSGQADILDKINLVFYGVFVAEMFLKLIGLGLRVYIRDNYNIFDVAIILLSTSEIILQHTTDSPMIRKTLVAFRALRFLRIFKIIRRWKSLQEFLFKLHKTIKEMANFLLLLLIFIVIYALLGMELYSNMIKFDNKGEPVNCIESDL